MRAPHAIGRFSGGNGVGVGVAAVDRVGDEEDGAVETGRIDAAAMVRLRRGDAPDVVAAVRADGRIRRKNGIKALDENLSVEPTLATPRGG